jgi:two-component system, sensor histidine kinase PdtaS
MRKLPSYLFLIFLFSFGYYDVSMAQSRSNYSESESLRASVDVNPEIFTVRSFALEAANDASAVRRELELDSLLNEASSKGDTIAVLTLKLKQAKFYLELDNKSRALALSGQVHRSMESDGPLRFHSGILLRKIYYQLGAYQKAMDIHSGLDWAAVPDYWETRVPDNFLSTIYYKIGDSDRAIRITKQSIDTMRKYQNVYWEVSFTNNLGVFYKGVNELDSAWYYFNRAQEILNTNFDPESKMDYDYVSGLILGNLAQVLASKDEHLRAIPLFKLDIQNSLKEPRTIEKHLNAIRSQLDLANSYTETEQFESAGKLIRNIQHELKTLNLGEALLDYWRIKWKLCEKKGDLKMALTAANRYNELKDSIDLSRNFQSLQNFQIAHESGQKESYIRQQDVLLSELRDQSEQDLFIRNVSISIAVLLLSLIMLVAYAFRNKSSHGESLAAQTKKIEEQSKLISKSLEEKDLLLREIHHRVKNNLQIISSLFFLQSKKIKDENARNIIREGQSRVHVMSLIHQKLYQAEHLNQIEFQGYLSDLAKQILVTNQTSKIEISLSIEADEITETVELAVPIGMMVNELMTNSIKHAFEGRKVGLISISLKRTGSMMTLEYEDDGRGVDSLESLNKEDSLGMKLIRLLTDQLDGAMEFSGANGFKITIEFEHDK